MLAIRDHCDDVCLKQQQRRGSEESEKFVKEMALVTTNPTINEGPLFAEVDMGSDFNAPTVRATVVQASTIFYDTPATLGPSKIFHLSLFYPLPFSVLCQISSLFVFSCWKHHLCCSKLVPVLILWLEKLSNLLSAFIDSELVVVFFFLWVDKAERLLAEAASYGSQLVVFPEAFVGGYPRGSAFGLSIGNRTAKGREEFRKYHSAAIDVPGKS